MRRSRDAAVHVHHVTGRPVRSLVTGEARPGVPELVLVPGLGALGYLLPTVRACARWTRVHLLDLPGFGASSTAGLPSCVDPVSRTLTAWLAEVPARPVLLAGHSTGAQVALRAAAATPDRLTALVLAGATFPPVQRRPLPLLAAAARTVVHEHPGELAAVLPEYRRGGRRLVALLRSAMADRPEELVPALRRPLLVVRGHRDRLCPRPWAEQLAAAAPDGRVLVLPGAHNTPYTHPGETAEALRVAGTG